MKTLLLVIEFVSAFALVVAILFHSAKGEGIGGIGGQARIFGSQKGMEAWLNKITTVLAVVFMVTAVFLGIMK